MMQELLKKYPQSKIVIVSGEGDGEGAIELYEDNRDPATITKKLKQERCSGDRWASARIYAGIALDGGTYSIDLETGEEWGWSEEPQ